MGRAAERPPIARLVLDTGALIALERGDARAIAALRSGATRRRRSVVPVLVAMEALAGTRSVARINQLLKAADVELSLTPPVGHAAVGIRLAAGTGSDTDACVVLEALAVPGSAIVSGDPDDMHALLEAAGAAGRVPVLRV